MQRRAPATISKNSRRFNLRDDAPDIQTILLRLFTCFQFENRDAPRVVAFVIEQIAPRHVRRFFLSFLQSRTRDWVTYKLTVAISMNFKKRPRYARPAILPGPLKLVPK